jgi:hypothetical protein
MPTDINRLMLSIPNSCTAFMDVNVTRFGETEERIIRYVWPKRRTVEVVNMAPLVPAYKPMTQREQDIADAHVEIEEFLHPKGMMPKDFAGSLHITGEKGE